MRKTILHILPVLALIAAILSLPWAGVKAGPSVDLDMSVSFDSDTETYIFSLVEYDGRLYAGTHPGGKVYAFDGATWQLVFDSPETHVWSLAVYNGRLYAGTEPHGLVYVYDGSGWALSYDTPEYHVDSLAVYNGRLYAGTWDRGRIYAYDGTTWTLALDLFTLLPDDTQYPLYRSHVFALQEYEGKLYAGTDVSPPYPQPYEPGGLVFVFDGSSWALAHDSSEQQVRTLAVYDAKLYAGTGFYGIIEVFDGTTWATAYDPEPYSLTITSLAVLNGNLYAGTTADGIIYGFDGVEWAVAFDAAEEGVQSLAVYSGSLYAGTYSEGRVYGPSGGSENTPPVADAGGSYSGSEGKPVQFDGSGSTDLDGDPLQYRWDFENDGAWDTEWSSDPATTHQWNDDCSGTVALEVTDGEAQATDTASVAILNTEPVVGPISLPGDPAPVGAPVAASASFSDAGSLDVHTALWDWGDGAASAGVVDEEDGSGTVSGDHQYATPGVYPVTLTVTDDDSGSGHSVFRYVVVYDCGAGFVTGGGWINSPAGACAANPSLTGKANFGFVAKYQKGAQVPTGQTEFQLNAADLNFHSTDYQWLVVAGAKAKYKGSGTINGSGDYGFMLTAVDGQVNGGGGLDKFRIKIWDKATGTVVYDNQMGAADDDYAATALGGGSIVIHSK